jgi:UPF0716 protein FxsA
MIAMNVRSTSNVMAFKLQKRSYAMRFLVLAILLGFPVLEGAVLYRIGQGHGLWVVAWLVLAAAMGIALIKEARFSLVARLAAAFAHGQFPLPALIDSGRTVLAGLFLIFPGVISDVIALFLLLLPLRERDMEVFSTLRGSVMDGEFRRES